VSNKTNTKELIENKDKKLKKPITLKIVLALVVVLVVTGAFLGQTKPLMSNLTYAATKTSVQSGIDKVLTLATKAENSFTRTLTQDFKWGVLALNPNKAIYTPGEKALIDLSVLDDKGEMDCNAKVILDITNPAGKTVSLSTENKKIIISDECTKSITDKPDFSTEYQTTLPGTYQMHLKGITKNGTQEIDDYFTVQDKPTFDITRGAPTRIYPPQTYKMIMTVKANRDFTGEITEAVPASYTITPGLFTIKEVANKKLLTWSETLKVGEIKTFEYIFKTPDISPEFYLLGPLTLTNQKENKALFTEARAWQIAGDAELVCNPPLFRWCHPGERNACHCISTCGNNPPSNPDGYKEYTCNNWSGGAGRQMESDCRWGWTCGQWACSKSKPNGSVTAGVCNLITPGTCSSGSPTAIVTSGCISYWACSGKACLNGELKDSQTSCSKVTGTPVTGLAGVCNNATLGACVQGSASAVTSSSCNSSWTCSGSAGSCGGATGSTASCSKAVSGTPGTNGSCGTTQQSCGATSGPGGNWREDANFYYWDCYGKAGTCNGASGSTASCSWPKPVLTCTTPTTCGTTYGACSNGSLLSGNGSTSWTCKPTDTKCSNQSCAISLPPNPAQCGTRATTYPESVVDWPSSSTYCLIGSNSSSPAFPNVNSSVSWNCTSGSNTASCTANRTQSCKIANITLDAPSDGAIYHIPVGADSVNVDLVATIDGCPNETKNLQIVFASWLDVAGWRVAGAGSFTGVQARYQLPITVNFKRTEIENPLNTQRDGSNNFALTYGWTAKGAAGDRTLGYQTPVPYFTIIAEKAIIPDNSLSCQILPGKGTAPLVTKIRPNATGTITGDYTFTFEDGGSPIVISKANEFWYTFKNPGKHVVTISRGGLTNTCNVLVSEESSSTGGEIAP